MAKKAKTELVHVNRLETGVEVTGDHVVALLVSQVDENISAQERETNTQIEILTKEAKVQQKQITDAVEKLRKAKQKQLAKSDILTRLKTLGFKGLKFVVTIHDYSDTKGHENGRKIEYVVNIVSTSRGNGLHAVETIAVPKPIADLRKNTVELDEQIQELRQKLLQLRSYRQNEMTRLERWAKGQIAAEALKRAGGDLQKFVGGLQDKLPRSLKAVLT